ncbi:MAG TPA: phosphoribosyltransferase family protein [Candidatus Paceibacterota bacterium]
MNVIDMMKRVGAIVTDGHFVGTNGRHMATYINKDRLISHPKYSSQIGRLFANKYKNKKIEVVVAPSVAGIPLSQWTAYHLSKVSKKEVLSIYTEKTSNNNQILKRGYDFLVKKKRVLIVEDVTTTGSSVKKVIASVKMAGGKVVGVIVIINRDPKLVSSKSVGVPFSALEVLRVASYEAKNCPLCKRSIPINTSLGHGKKFLEK